VAEIPLGLCQCGCGRPAPIAPDTNRSKGWVKGEALPRVAGHHNRKALRYLVQDCGYKTPCWVWQLTRHPFGYGQTQHEGQMQPAHRIYYERAKGPIPRGLVLDHLCRNPPCVNPDHLEPVTRQENVRRGAGVKLNWAKVGEIRTRAAGGESNVALGAAFGVSAQRIGEVVRGRAWT
jgi:hypothetical protein